METCFRTLLLFIALDQRWHLLIDFEHTWNFLAPPVRAPFPLARPQLLPLEGLPLRYLPRLPRPQRQEARTRHHHPKRRRNHRNRRVPPWRPTRSHVCDVPQRFQRLGLVQRQPAGGTDQAGDGRGKPVSGVLQGWQEEWICGVSVGWWHALLRTVRRWKARGAGMAEVQGWRGVRGRVAQWLHGGRGGI